MSWAPFTAAENAELSKIRQFTGTGYTVTIPIGWRATGHAALARAGDPPSLDSLWRGYIGPQGVSSANVVVVSRPSEDLAQQAADGIQEIRSSLGAEAEDLSIKPLPDSSVAGGPAANIGMSYALNGRPLRATSVVFDHGPHEFVVTLTTPTYRFDGDDAQLQQALATWRWQ